jgi:putative Holliday junction resolvase
MNDEFPLEGRLIGVDFGTVRIGLALSDPGQSLASPLETYSRQNPEQDARRFCRLIQDEEVVGFVVGLPVFNSGDESPKSREAREFGKWLTETTTLPVRFYDERYTTAHANQILEFAGVTSKKRKKQRDKLAAQILLSAYLESNKRPDVEPGALDD